VLAILKTHGVPMFVKVVKMTPRIVMDMFFAVTLTLLAFAVAAMSFLGFTLAVQGWAANPPITIHAPAQPKDLSYSWANVLPAILALELVPRAGLESASSVLNRIMWLFLVLSSRI
jgi:hypothetical protein